MLKRSLSLKVIKLKCKQINLWNASSIKDLNEAYLTEFVEYQQSLNSNTNIQIDPNIHQISNDIKVNTDIVATQQHEKTLTDSATTSSNTAQKHDLKNDIISNIYEQCNIVRQVEKAEVIYKEKLKQKRKQKINKYVYDVYMCICNYNMCMYVYI